MRGSRIASSGAQQVVTKTHEPEFKFSREAAAVAGRPAVSYFWSEFNANACTRMNPLGSGELGRADFCSENSTKAPAGGYVERQKMRKRRLFMLIQNTLSY